MKFVVYLDAEGTTWPEPTHAPGVPTVLDVDPETKFEDAAREAIKVAGREMSSRYAIADGGPYFWAMGLRDASVEPPELVRFARVAIDADGEFLWTEGARDRMTLADLRRAQESGFYEGDPGGVFLERPMFGEAPPGWEDFLQWIADFAGVIAAVSAFVGFVRRQLERWKSRGANTPFDFLDLVVGRDEWKLDQLCELLRLDANEGSDLLAMLGFEADTDDPNHWRAQSDPGRSTLRGRIIYDWLHRQDSGDDEEDMDES